MMLAKRPWQGDSVSFFHSAIVLHGRKKKADNQKKTPPKPKNNLKKNKTYKKQIQNQKGVA